MTDPAAEYRIGGGGAFLVDYTITNQGPFDFRRRDEFVLGDKREVPYAVARAAIEEFGATERREGGPVPIGLAYLNALGFETPFIGVVGADQDGRLLRRFARRHLGSDHGLQDTADGSGISLLIVDSESDSGRSRRTILHTPNVNSNPNAVPGGLDSFARPLDGWHLDGRDAGAIEVARRVKARGRPVLCDVGTWRDGETRKRLAVATHAQFPRRSAVACLRQLGIPDAETVDMRRAAHIIRRHYRLVGVAVTDGEKGFAFSEKGRTAAHKALAVDDVDTNGAGDVFGAFTLAGIVAGYTYEQSLLRASGFAAVSVTHHGHEKLLSEPHRLLSEATSLSQSAANRMSTPTLSRSL